MQRKIKQVQVINILNQNGMYACKYCKMKENPLLYCCNLGCLYIWSAFAYLYIDKQTHACYQTIGYRFNNRYM